MVSPFPDKNQSKSRDIPYKKLLRLGIYLLDAVPVQWDNRSEALNSKRVVQTGATQGKEVMRRMER